MLYAVDPLVQRIEALPKRGSFAVTLVLGDGQERILAITIGTEGDVVLPKANLPTGWSPDSAAGQSLLAAVTAFHQARTIASAGRALLVDVDGGWDVSIGNVILTGDGRPECVAHGVMTQLQSQFECEECGAAAVFADG
jgi:hypothetical protein